MATVTTLSHRKGKNENISFNACSSYIYLYIPLYIIKWGIFYQEEGRSYAIILSIRSFNDFSTGNPPGILSFEDWLNQIPFLPRVKIPFKCPLKHNFCAINECCRI